MATDGRQLSGDKTSIDFGNIGLNIVSPVQTLRIQNSGVAGTFNAVITGIGHPFYISATNVFSAQLGTVFTMEPGDISSIAIVVSSLALNPLDITTASTSSIVISGSDDDLNEIHCALSTYLTAGWLSANITTLDFDRVALQAFSPAQTIGISNTGNVSMTVIVTGIGDPFHVSGSNAFNVSPSATFTMLSGSVSSIAVVTSSTVLNSPIGADWTGSIVVSANDYNVDDKHISLSTYITGGWISANRTDVNFGTIEPLTVDTNEVLTISNSGNTTIHFTTAYETNARFYVSAGDPDETGYISGSLFSLASGTASSINIAFSSIDVLTPPTKRYSSALTFLSDDINNPTYTILLSGAVLDTPLGGYADTNRRRLYEMGW